MSYYPIQRPRRLRENSILRSLVQEVEFSASRLIYPLFVKENLSAAHPVSSMPGIVQHSLSSLKEEILQLKALGLKGVLLFGIPEKKDERGSLAYSENNIVCQTIEIIKENAPEMLVFADVCLCEYTSHGHCGLLAQEGPHLRIENDATLELLSKMSALFARAGADVIAPSDMMDGRIGVIRDELDAIGFKHLPILSYAVKYASSFYGPFREAAESAPGYGDRKSYQMNPANSREAIFEASLDIEEGADILMVKPALAYLDIIYQLKQKFTQPIAAYQVSGEYSMIKAAAQLGYMDEEKVIFESLLSIQRAGASLIFTYFAKDVLKKLSNFS